jgi:hypothetical protein
MEARTHEATEPSKLFNVLLRLRSPASRMNREVMRYRVSRELYLYACEQPQTHTHRGKLEQLVVIESANSESQRLPLQSMA